MRKMNADDYMEKLISKELASLTDAQLKARMEAAMDIQKRNPPDSAEWRDASETIHDLSAENARRHGVRVTEGWAVRS